MIDPILQKRRQHELARCRLDPKQAEYLATFPYTQIIDALVANRFIKKGMSNVQMEQIIQGTLASGFDKSIVYASKDFSAKIMRTARLFIEEMQMNHIMIGNILKAWNWKGCEELFVYVMVYRTVPEDYNCGIDFIVNNPTICATLYNKYFTQLLDTKDYAKRDALHKQFREEYIAYKNNWTDMIQRQVEFDKQKQIEAYRQQNATLIDNRNKQIDIDFSSFFV